MNLVMAVDRSPPFRFSALYLSTQAIRRWRQASCCGSHRGFRKWWATSSE